jgi:hypothetical protein
LIVVIQKPKSHSYPFFPRYSSSPMFPDPTKKNLKFSHKTYPYELHNQHWVKCTQNKPFSRLYRFGNLGLNQNISHDDKAKLYIWRGIIWYPSGCQLGALASMFWVQNTPCQTPCTLVICCILCPFSASILK